MFSRRTDWDLTPNRLSAAVEARRRGGGRIIDLTDSNPTRCGLDCWGEDLAATLAAGDFLRYHPAPFGPPAGRRAVAEEYRRRGSPIDEERVILTCSTSESYSHLFRLLADPGDRVLVPAPSYPLFPFLAQLDHLELGHYPLLPGDSFRIDMEALAGAADARTRAILIVNPGNPTGAFLKRDEAGKLIDLCRERGLALISDEVFSAFAFAGDPGRVPTLAGRDEILNFALDGLSKSLGLPQLKVGWIVVSGPPGDRRDALSRLEVICDTFLSVNAPAAVSLPELLKKKPAVIREIGARVGENRRQLCGILEEDGPIRCLPSEGGWYAILQVPATPTDEEWCLRLLEERGVLVHPGYFFDFPETGYLVVGLLTAPGPFREGARAIVETITG